MVLEIGPSSSVVAVARRCGDGDEPTSESARRGAGAGQMLDLLSFELFPGLGEKRPVFFQSVESSVPFPVASFGLDAQRLRLRLHLMELTFEFLGTGR